MSSSKMKSLLKGLRYITQVFESEKEEEIQIGNPTDVKHVAHIGWDGASPNATPPSWMTEFKSGESGEGVGEDDVASLQCMSECGARSRDLPKLPKSTRKSASEKGSPTKAELGSSEKTKRRSSNKGKSSSSRKSKQGVSEEQDFTSWSRGLPEVPKKSRRKKKTTKESSAYEGPSTRSANRTSDVRTSDVDSMSDYMSETGSIRSMPQFDRRDDFY